MNGHPYFLKDQLITSEKRACGLFFSGPEPG